MGYAAVSLPMPPHAPTRLVSQDDGDPACREGAHPDNAAQGACIEKSSRQGCGSRERGEADPKCLNTIRPCIVQWMSCILDTGSCHAEPVLDLRDNLDT